MKLKLIEYPRLLWIISDNKFICFLFHFSTDIFYKVIIILYFNIDSNILFLRATYGSYNYFVSESSVYLLDIREIIFLIFII